MRHRFLLAWIVSLGVFAPGCSQAPRAIKPPGHYDAKLTVDGLPRTYHLWVPHAYDGSRRMAMVVLLHGWTSSGSQVAQYSGFIAEAEREGFVLVAPDGLGDPPGWNVGWINLSRPGVDDVKFVGAVMDDVERQMSIDPQRVYVAGHSNGAMLAGLCGSKMSGRVAAVAAVAGSIGLPALDGRPEQVIAAPVNPLSVLIIHGDHDRMVAYDADSPAFLKGIGAESSAKWWAKAMRASLSPTIAKDGGSIVTRTYANGLAGTEVVFVTVKGGVHDWPRGAAYDATPAIWAFFRSHPKKR